MDVPDVRRRVRAAIDQARRDAAARRERTDAASKEYEEFLANRAVPALGKLAEALTAEGHPFKVFTPAGSVRLASDRSPDDFVELTLDASEDPPAVLGRSSTGRGRRSVTREQHLRAKSIADLSDADVLTFALDEVISIIER